MSIADMRCDVCGCDVSAAGRSGPEPYGLRCRSCPDERVEQLGLFNAEVDQ